MKSKMRSKLSGQSLVIVGVLIASGVLIGLVALAFDGGSALLQRRNMQAGADAASLGTAKMLAASVVLSSSVPIYGALNQNVVSTTVQFLTANRGGATGVPTYTSIVEYGNFVESSSSYTFTTMAVYDGTSWSYTAPYLSNRLVPSWVDAVKVTAAVDNPTTFGRAIGLNHVSVSAKAAAALRGVSNHVATGPTWPMIALASATPDPATGICNPVLFWESNPDNPGFSGNFKNLVQLGAHQGDKMEGAHLQLIARYDHRAVMADATSGNENFNKCPPGQAVGLWAPQGNCSATNGTGTLGDYCCDYSSHSPVDVENWITHDFTGRLSLTSTTWLGEDNQYHDWRSTYDTYHGNVAGDWPEVYNGGNFGSSVQDPLYEYINSPEHRQVDNFYAAYGYHVDKLMYRYDYAQVWARATDDSCGGHLEPECPMAWLSSEDPRAGNNPVPGRVHVSQALMFRFYSAMASQGGFDTPAAYCGTSQHINTSGSKIYGVFIGGEVTDPPPDPGGSGLFNYVGFIDP